MKLIIDISEYNKEWIGNLHFIPEELKFEIGNAIMDGTPFDSVIEDIKAEINKNIINEYTGKNEYEIALSDGLELALQIIDKHIGDKDK